MIERTVTVVPEAGLHARPATKFVQTAQEYDAEVQVGRLGEDQVPASSMLSVTGLGVGNGEEVRLTADGPDEEAAIDALAEILTTPEVGEGDSGSGDGEQGSSDAAGDREETDAEAGDAEEVD